MNASHPSLRSLANRTLPKAVALDLDGVVYAGNATLPGATTAIAHLRKLGIQPLFLTNNSSRTAQDISERLQKLGVECVPREVMTSLEGSVEFLLQKFDFAKAGVFAVGSPRLFERLAEVGIPLAEPAEAQVLLVGHDPDFNFHKLTRAMHAAMRPIPAYCCNRDVSYPAEGAIPYPGCGAWVAAIEAAASRTMDRTLGKPGTFMLEVLAARFGIAPAQCIVIGDGLQSDIAMAQSLGVPGVWIRSPQTALAAAHAHLLRGPEFEAETLAQVVDALAVRASSGS